MSQEPHWADRLGDQILREDRPPVISTGISPSGEIHIGNMREVITGDALYRVLRERGRSVRFNYVADNFDPLRRVYPFLDAATYEPLVGRPLSEIPCPCGGHASYADHFLQPFIEALDRLQVEVEVERADQMYKSGRMTPYIVTALEQRDRIARILQELTGKSVEPGWSPFSPLCPDCGRLGAPRVRGYSAAKQSVEYECGCGSCGSVPMAGGGKLVWRIDWPARWMLLSVTVEPFGKDHATRGGSYDTGARIIREVFGGEPPFPIPYEWIRLRGGGDMSSSKGNVLSIGEVLKVAPPEALRYLVIRERPQKTIRFDPGIPLLQLVDELDNVEAAGRDERAIELSRAAGFEPVEVPYRHFVVVAQAADFSTERAIEILARTGYPNVTASAVDQRMGFARRWLESFAPDELRFTVQKELPTAANRLDAVQRAFLGRLAQRLRPGQSGEEIHSVIYELATGFPQSKPAAFFEAIYLALLGKSRGPRAGWFLSLLGPERCARRFEEAARERPERQID